ncbi:DUF6221 family protein [Streptomyces misionensis]
MDDLVQFLRARLDEDEQTARRAGDSFRQIGETGVIVATEGDRAEECASANWAGIAEHIVHHDPARVLAEVDAKRRLVDEHKPSRSKGRPNMERGCLSCTTAQEWDAKANEANCLTLRLLALPYADHPGYREEWRP